MADIPYEQLSHSRLRAALESGALVSVGHMLNDLHPGEIAHLLESLPPRERLAVWRLVEPTHEGDVLLLVNDQVRAQLIRAMNTDELVAAAENLETDDLADLIQDLPHVVIQQVLQSMDVQDRQRLQAVLSYPEDTAGGLMNTDAITVRPNVTLDVVLRYLRLRGGMPDMTDSLVVVDRNDNFQGVLRLTDLLTSDPDKLVSEVMHRDYEAVSVTLPAGEVAKRFAQRDLVSVPVIDEEGKLVGRVTIDDVVDVIREEADHSMMSMAGLSEAEDLFSPVISSARRRAVWLGINLATAFIASFVIGIFDATIEKVVALAILMPIVASMGGIAGSQTVTLVIRGMALGHVSQANARRLVLKELAVGAINGLLWALVVGVLASLWFHDYRLGVIIGAAMTINLITAALIGALLPMILRRYGADPALSGTVILTTFTDVVGFFSFLGLGTLFLL